jgi:ABC-type multidrug transport system ATPase subunit
LQQIFHVNRGKKHIQKLWCSKALDNISFSINKGEIVGFLGPNGAGKSTLMKMTTYINADEGDALVNGHNVNTNQKAVQLAIGYCRNTIRCI